jgi:hypothetical protein
VVGHEEFGRIQLGVHGVHGVHGMGNCVFYGGTENKFTASEMAFR